LGDLEIGHLKLLLRYPSHQLSEGRGQEDGAFKVANQVRHTAPPEGRRQRAEGSRGEEGKRGRGEEGTRGTRRRISQSPSHQSPVTDH